jgi:hypothetical protein
MTISTILNPSEKKIKKLQKRQEQIQEEESPEGQFLSGIMSKAQENMQGVEVDMNNPTSAIMGLMQSGVITDMISGLQHGVASGQMDPRKLFSTMQKTLGNMMPPEESSIEEVEDSPKSAGSSKKKAITQKECIIEDEEE